MTHSDGYYHSVATLTHGVVSNDFIGRASMPMTQGWAVYNAAVVPLVDMWGNVHHITHKRHRIILDALGKIARGDTDTTLRAWAKAMECAPTTVSTALRQAMSWGILGYMSSRGKYGGLTLFARHKADGLERYARMAQDAIRAFWDRRKARFRAQSNVQSLIYGVSEVRNSTYSTSRLDIRIDRDERRRAFVERMSEALGCDPSRSQGRVPCPAHGEGRSKTLSWKRTHDGGLMYHCFAGCTPADIRQATGC